MIADTPEILLSEDRYLGPDPAQKEVAQNLYQSIVDRPLICPHGHVDPRLFADPDYTFGSPADLLIVPDHYVFRMLYSQGVSLESLGIARRDGQPVETDHRKIWQTFAYNFYLFRGTPTGVWFAHELRDVFGVRLKLTTETAQEIYDQIADCLTKPAFRPRALFEQFNIEVLSTTDPATDTLSHHQQIRDSEWSGTIIPTFRPDAVINLMTQGWHDHINDLSDVTSINVHSYDQFIQALEKQRSYFKTFGATATDYSTDAPYTESLSAQKAETIFQQALSGQATEQSAAQFAAHMLMEMARMSVEDGLVMQLHVGSYRNHNKTLFDQFGGDMGCDIPMQTEYTRNLAALLNAFGNNPKFNMILFTLDETTYSRELAPLAGHYPAIKLGPPWWFHDSLNGLQRYFDQVMETAGIYNTAGFNDDTRAFPSIPARHDLWRRAVSNWVAGLVVRGIVDDADATAMADDMAYGLAKRAYHFA
ncbi:MAG: glucuronate isomerase [Chloroflexota bacterium]